jgi:hypothetical protein
MKLKHHPKQRRTSMQSRDVRAAFPLTRTERGAV